LFENQIKKKIEDSLGTDFEVSPNGVSVFGACLETWATCIFKKIKCFFLLKINFLYIF
jgi:hypothetical protein